jgi:signal transduction histidine kinase
MPGRHWSQVASCWSGVTRDQLRVAEAMENEHVSTATELPAPARGRSTPSSMLGSVLRAPFTRRAHRELLFSFIGVLVGATTSAVIVALLQPGTAASVARGGPIIAALLLIVVATGVARRLGSVLRRLAARLLGERVASPPPFRPGRGMLGRVGARLRDSTGWRAAAYMLLKVPLGMLESYALFYWAGLIYLTYPFWWQLFRNHPPNVHLRPVTLTTPFGAYRIHTFPGTFVAFAVGAAMVLAAPWVTRAVTSVDRWLVRNLLGPGRLAARVRDLEETRAHVVDDSAATLRRIERDLHDGAQIRLAALAMTLGMIKENLEGGGEASLDLGRTRELVDAAHRNAKDALVELRGLARGIHPPVLDAGLDAALATLAASIANPSTSRSKCRNVRRRQSRRSRTSAWQSFWRTSPSTAGPGAPRSRSVSVAAGFC